MSRPLCIYHNNCADGFTAAWIINKKYNGEVDFVPGIYQTPPPDVKGRDVIFVDFSYKRPVMEVILNLANSVTILDHHKTAIEDIGGLPFTDARLDPKFSGAGLAWQWAFPGTDMPLLVEYVQDRDLWTFNLPCSRDANAYIFSHHYTFCNWNELTTQFENDFKSVAERGQAIERKHHKDVYELSMTLRRNMEIGGHVVPVANMPYTYTSDAGHLMAKELTGGKAFAACYWDTKDGRVFSLRSTEDGIDVSEIAKQYGGGGHTHAAGFTVPFEQLAEKGLL